jgi:hypothetical protein
LAVATVTIAGRSHTAVTAAPVPPGCRPAWRRTSSAVRRRPEPANPASWNALLPPVPALSGKAACAAGLGVPAGQVAGPGRHRGRHERDLIVPAENRPVHRAWCSSRRSASAYRTLVSTTITNSAGYRPQPSASGSSARPDTAVLRRFCSLGYEGAEDLTGCPGHPAPAGRVSRERRWLSCPCPVLAAARPHRRAHDLRELFSDNTV